MCEAWNWRKRRRSSHPGALSARLLCILLVFAWVGEVARGEPLRLFSSPGVPVANYNELVAGIGPGDEIAFSDGRVFRVESKLGRGATTLILAVEGGEALRIPVWYGTFYVGPEKRKRSMLEFIDGFASTQKILEALGVPVVKMFGYQPSEYVHVKRIPIAFSYKEFLNGKAALSEGERREVEDALVQWARRTWPLTQIGDLTSEQLVYSPGLGWILIDADAGVTRAGKVNSPTVFYRNTAEFLARRIQEEGYAYGLRAPPHLTASIFEAVREERGRHGLPVGNSCIEFLKYISTGR